MTNVDLENEIKSRIEKALKNLKLNDKFGNSTEISIITGELPPPNIKNGNSLYKDMKFPLISVKLAESGDNTEESEVLFLLMIGVCVEAENAENRNYERRLENFATGHHDLMTIEEKLRQDFLSSKRIGNGNLKQFKIKNHTNNPYPYMFSEVTILINRDPIEESIGKLD